MLLVLTPNTHNFSAFDLTNVRLPHVTPKNKASLTESPAPAKGMQGLFMALSTGGITVPVKKDFPVSFHRLAKREQFACVSPLSHDFR